MTKRDKFYVHGYLNPKFQKTKSMTDYYGIYEVREIGTERVRAMYVGSERHKAYEEANKLNQEGAEGFDGFRYQG